MLSKQNVQGCGPILQGPTQMSVGLKGVRIHNLSQFAGFGATGPKFLLI